MNKYQIELSDQELKFLIDTCWHLHEQTMFKISSISEINRNYYIKLAKEYFDLYQVLRKQLKNIEVQYIKDHLKV